MFLLFDLRQSDVSDSIFGDIACFFQRLALNIYTVNVVIFAGGKLSKIICKTIQVVEISH